MSSRRLIIILLSGFALTGYLLRMNISIAAKMMMPELGLDKVQMGQVFSAFMLGYALFQIPWGILGDRFGPRRVLTVAALTWGTTTILTGLLPGKLVASSSGAFFALIILRFLLGVGEAAAFPVAARAVASWMDETQRGFSYSFVIFGISAGCASAAPLISYLMVNFGWRGSFYISASLAFLLAIVWEISSKRVPEETAADEISGRAEEPRSEAHAPWTTLLKNPNIALVSTSYFLDSYLLFVFVFWFYLYLVEKRGFSTLSGGFYTAAPFLTAMIIGPINGYVCDYLAERSGRHVGRRVVAMGGLILSSLFLWLGLEAASPYRAVLWICLSVGFLLSTEGAFWSASMDLAPNNAGAAGGIMNTAGNLGGVVSTALVPVLIQRFGWNVAFGSASIIALAGAVIWLWVRLEPRREQEGPELGNGVFEAAE
ncbi:MAG TPA: MFS transporter [Candidatus Sulfotelmatobacter sp.]|nr:MFS transporter [Candidatus Sulfotelmatobacter sp.]